MSKYLKLFNEDAEYQQFKETEEYILPNVSYVKADNIVYYNPFETVKLGVIMARYNATEDNMLALADTSNVKSLKVNGENIVFDPVQIINKSIEIVGENVVVNEDGTGEYPDEYMHFFSEGTPIKITIKLKDESLNVADFNCISILGKYGGEDVKWCDILLIEDAINNGWLSFDKTNNALIVNLPSNECNAVGFVLGNVDVEQEMWVPVFVDTVNEMEIKAGGMPEMYYFNEVGEYDVEIELIDPTLINGMRYDENDNIISNSMFSDGVDWIGACLTSVVIPDSVTSIGYSAFYSCSGLTSVVIPDSVTYIGEWAFYDCTSLPVENNLRYVDTYLVGVADNSLSTYTIKEGTKWIGAEAFADCSGLTSIVIPDSVTSIGQYAFSNCSGLTGELVIPDSVTYIGDSAFYGCTGLTSITIPDSVTTISAGVFDLCTHLTSINIPDSVTSIGRYAFHTCYSLTSITIPDSVTTIGGHAFEACSALASIVIPYSVTTIEDDAFAHCRRLTTVNISDSVTEIGEMAFKYCDGLSEITCNATTAPSINYDTFRDIKEGGILKVPTGSDYSAWMSTDNYYLGKYNWTIEYIIPENAKVLEIPYDEEGNARQTEELFNLIYANLGEENVKNNVYANTSVSVKEATGYDYIRYTRDSESFSIFNEIQEINANDDRISIGFGNSVYSYHFSNNSYETVQVPA